MWDNGKSSSVSRHSLVPGAREMTSSTLKKTWGLSSSLYRLLNPSRTLFTSNLLVPKAAPQGGAALQTAAVAAPPPQRAAPPPPSKAARPPYEPPPRRTPQAAPATVAANRVQQLLPQQSQPSTSPQTGHVAQFPHPPANAQPYMNRQAARPASAAHPHQPAQPAQTTPYQPSPTTSTSPLQPPTTPHHSTAPAATAPWEQSAGSQGRAINTGVSTRALPHHGATTSHHPQGAHPSQGHGFPPPVSIWNGASSFPLDPSSGRGHNPAGMSSAGYPPAGSSNGAGHASQSGPQQGYSASSRAGHGSSSGKAVSTAGPSSSYYSHGAPAALQPTSGAAGGRPGSGPQRLQPARRSSYGGQAAVNQIARDPSRGYAQAATAQAVQVVERVSEPQQQQHQQHPHSYQWASEQQQQQQQTLQWQPAQPPASPQLPAAQSVQAPHTSTQLPSWGAQKGPARPAPVPQEQPADVFAAATAPLPLAPGELPPDVFIVNDADSARHAVKVLREFVPRPNVFDVNKPVNHDDRRYFACDTEVAYIEVKEESPIGHGAVVCFSIYGGPDINFNPDPDGLKQDRLWIDVWHEVERDVDGRPVMEFGKVKLVEPHPILAEFRTFFEDDGIAKVWHNYGFDRHVLANMGIECRGFAADTLHMARLMDASRRGKKTYGLDSLTADRKVMGSLLPKPQRATAVNPNKATAAVHMSRRGRSMRTMLQSPGAPPAPDPTQPPHMLEGQQAGAAAHLPDIVRAKVSMKELFGKRHIKADGSEGKLVTLPPIHELHEQDEYRGRWIDYSALDAKATWYLREALYRHLKDTRWVLEQGLSRVLGHNPNDRNSTSSLYDFYKEYWVPFGEILTDMEKEGMMVDREHLRQAQAQAEADQQKAIKTFLAWADKLVPGAQYMNPSSGAQIRQLLFPDFPGIISKGPRKDPSVEAGPPQPTGPASYEPGVLMGPDSAPPADGSDGEDAKPKKTRKSSKAAEPLPAGCRMFKVPNPEYEKEMQEYEEAKVARGSKKGVKLPTKPKKYRDIMLHGIWGAGQPGRIIPEVITATNAAAVSLSVLRTLAGKPGAARKALEEVRRQKQEAEDQQALAAAQQEQHVNILEDEYDELERQLHPDDDPDEGADEGADEGEERQAAAAAGTAEAQRQSEAQQKKLEEEAKSRGFGKLYAALGGGEKGLEACVAIEALCEVSAIDKLLTAFIVPLQGDNISTTDLEAKSRVHCSLNINTETGRLSARRPNLQNQPALEKDRYKVRKAFTADVKAGNTLVVADYGQLELRILAHMAACKSMMEAFELGGDFHSRTAYGMYDYIKEDVAKGNCILEWEGQGAPTAPLLKDKYASERRKAKILNFSIAYGKTAHGLAKDFNTSLEEAKATVERWYADRREVREWQQKTINEAKKHGVNAYVSTLMGRHRPLPDINSADRGKRGHAERAAINTPIQGSAADVATAAMVAIARCPDLKRIGYKLIMQVHDEVILEGPKKHAAEAQRLVQSHMSNPWKEAIEAAVSAGRVKPDVLGDKGWPLLVELLTDCDSADTWYDAK